jgi:predicted Fe-Mo cluster-binding NifX family protein
MKVAIPTKDWTDVSGHAGQARQWLVYDLSRHAPQNPLPEPARVTLTKEQTPHYLEDSDAPHPLDGVEVIVAGSAGDGFIRHMKTRGADVLLTGEPDAATALRKLISGEDQPDQRFDITTSLCKLRDLFSRH